MEVTGICSSLCHDLPTGHESLHSLAASLTHQVSELAPVVLFCYPDKHPYKEDQYLDLIITGRYLLASSEGDKAQKFQKPCTFTEK